MGGSPPTICGYTHQEAIDEIIRLRQVALDYEALVGDMNNAGAAIVALVDRLAELERRQKEVDRKPQPSV